MINELLEQVLISVLSLYGFDPSESKDLVKVLEKTEIINDLGSSYSEEEVLEQLNKSMQNHFLRPKGMERQQLVDKFTPAQKKELIEYLSPFVKEINSGAVIPNKILLGGAQNSVKERFDYLITFADTTQVVYSLGGKRDLWPIMEEYTSTSLSKQLSSSKNISFEEAKKEVNTEMQKIFAKATILENQINSNHYDISEVQELQSNFEKETNKARAEAIQFFTDTPYKFKWPTETEMMDYIINSNYKYNYQNIDFMPTVDTPKKPNGARPDTLDSLKFMWEKYGNMLTEQAKKAPGDKVVISLVTTQPYGHYQTQQASAAFHDKPVEIKTLAKKIENVEEMNLTNVLDSFARTIYAGKELVKEKIKNSPDKNKWQNFVCAPIQISVSSSFKMK
ncbi:hypothetical protein NOVO_06820 [Rickettsiales bacterium Ac37b]|nr:hypothetical protein NOVO_06820 [Rickettsiales bacterium Ac37b]